MANPMAGVSRRVRPHKEITFSWQHLPQSGSLLPSDGQRSHQILAARVEPWTVEALTSNDVVRGGEKLLSKAYMVGRAAVLAAVTDAGAELRHAPPKLRADREIVLAAVAQDGLALQFAAKAFRADAEVALAAVNSNGHALRFTNCVRDVWQMGSSGLKTEGLELLR